MGIQLNLHLVAKQLDLVNELKKRSQRLILLFEIVDVYGKRYVYIYTNLYI